MRARHAADDAGHLSRRRAASAAGRRAPGAARPRAAARAQTYGLGNKAELLAAVRAPDGRDGRVAISLTTDLPAAAVLHWGVRRGRGQDWLLPPQVPPHALRRCAPLRHGARLQVDHMACRA